MQAIALSGLQDQATSSRARFGTFALVMGFAGLCTVAALVAPALVTSNRLIAMSVDSVVSAVPVMVVTYLVGLCVVVVLSDLPRRGWLYSFAFVLRIVAMLFLSFLFQGDDEIIYHHAALRHTHGLWSWKAGSGYYHLNELVYAAFGPNPLLPKTLNVLLGSLLPFLAYDVALQTFHDRRVAWRSWWWTAVLPPTVLYSAFNLKEIPTCFLFATSLSALCRPWRSSFRFLGAAFSVAALYWLRDAPWALVAGAGCAVCFALGAGPTRRTVFGWTFGTRLAAAGVLMTLLALVLVPAVTTMLSDRLTRGSLFHAQFRGSSAMVMQFVDRSHPLSVANATVFFLRGLYAPSPLGAIVNGDFGTLVQASNMLVWYVVFPFAVIGIAGHLRQGTVLASAVMVLGVLIMATVGIPMGANAERHRFANSALLFVLAAAGVQRWSWTATRWVFCCWWLGAAVFSAAWFSMRM